MAMTKLATIADVERLPDDDYRYALIRGVLYRMPPPMPRHGRITTVIVLRVGTFVEEHDLGVVYENTGFALARDPDVLLAPDVAFVRGDRLPGDEDRYPDLAPDLAIEVVSPSNTGPNIADKVEEYLAAGVVVVWVFDPRRRTVAVHRTGRPVRVLTEADELDGEDVLPGFRLRLDGLF